MQVTPFRILSYVLILGLILEGWALADIYEYVDHNGIHHFTNTPTHWGYRLIIKEKVRPRGETQYFGPLISEASGLYRLDPCLVKAVIRAESDFDHRAVSHKGAMGLMQLMPCTARDLRVFDPFDPQQNIRGGVRYLKQLLARFDGDLCLALAAYNAGPEQVDKYNGIPPFEETQNFVDRVLRYYQEYQDEV
jgi:soluble lytic murein transglycosylase